MRPAAPVTNFGDVSIQTSPRNGTAKTRLAPPLHCPYADPSLKKNDLGHVHPVSSPAYRDRVAEWTGEGRDTAELYLAMATHELHGVSPSYEALCRAVAGSEPICALLDRRLGPQTREPA